MVATLTHARTVEEFVPRLSPRQGVAWEALQDPAVSELLFGGAKGGGKSVFLVFWMFLECYALAKRFFPTVPTFPVVVGWMGRKQSVDFSNTTLETWKRFIPPEFYTLSEGNKEIIIAERVKIDYGGLDRREDVHKFNSAEYARVAIDQAEETLIDDISVLRGSLRLIIKGEKIPAKVLWTANPGQCWLKNDFIISPKPGLKFVKSLPGDNPYLGEEYVKQLKHSFSHRPELLEAYLYGSWDAFEGADQIIKSVWVREAVGRRCEERRYPIKVITCDPARFGDDETVIYYLEDGAIKDEVIYGQKDTMYTAGRLAVMAREKEALVVVDAIGVGGGVVDRLGELGIEVAAVNCAERSQDERYYNLRAEIWDTAAKRFSQGGISLNSQDERLHSQLCTPCYKFKQGRLAVESKDEIKKRLTTSPDRADAYVQGLWQTEMTLPSFSHESPDSYLGVGLAKVGSYINKSFDPRGR